MIQKSLLVLLLLLASNLNAQNWQPLNTSETFHYKRDTAGYIEQSVRVDSVTVSGVDTVWHLTRIMVPCPGCTSPQPYALYQPTCLMRQMSHNPTGEFTFSDTLTYFLPTLASPGAMWTWSGSVTATLSTVTEETVFGTLDSVKTILLSSGDTVLLSRRHGLLSFPHGGSLPPMRLVGIAGRELGQLLPNFLGFYDFDPNEVYQYHETYSNGDVIDYRAREDWWKITIDTAIYAGASLTVEFHGFHKWGVQYGFSSPMEYGSEVIASSSFVITDSATHITHALPDEGMRANSLTGNYFGTWTPWYTFPDVCDGHSTCISAPSYSLRPDGRVQLNYMPDDLSGPFGDGLTGTPDLIGTRTTTYVEGLGMTSNSWWHFEPTGSWNLDGAWVDGDTIGVLDADSTFLVGALPCSSFEVAIFPNPTSDLLYLRLEENGVIAMIYSPEGKLLLREALDSAHETLSLAQLPQGLLLLKLENARGSAWKKIQVVR